MNKRLYYYTQKSLMTGLRLDGNQIIRITLKGIKDSKPFMYFRANSIKTIKDNSEKVEGDCADNTKLSKFKVGKKYKALIADPLKVEPVRTGNIVCLKHFKYAEFRVNNNFYVYSWLINDELNNIKKL